MKRVFAVLVIAAMAIFAIQSAPADKTGCPSYCTLVWAPLCASDGKCFKQFDNKCMMDIENCKNTTVTKFSEKYSGDCKEKAESFCKLNI